MILVRAPLNGSNYLSWSGAIIIVLYAKDKSSFVNRKAKKPETESLSYK